MIVRPYEAADEQGWLRCRVLAFLASAYFDDVLRTKPQFAGAAIELVAIEGGEVVGVLDVTVEGSAATIETIGGHPDHARRGVAAALLADALRRLPGEVESLDAWTRDDAAANAWYQKSGFREEFRYLHVYARDDETDRAVERSLSGLTPIAGFFHADIAREAEMRDAFRRVHICRQYVRACRAAGGDPPPTLR